MSDIDFNYIREFLINENKNENIQELLSMVIQFSSEESLSQVITNLDVKYFTTLKSAVLKAKPPQNAGKSKKRRQTKRRIPTKKSAFGR